MGTVMMKTSSLLFVKTLLWYSIVYASCLVAPAPTTAQQCLGDPEGTAGFVWAKNFDVQTQTHMLRWWDGAVQRPIQLADPTILKLRDATGQTWLFLTGTDSGQCFNGRRISATNFVIYRSTNLVDWYHHSFAFERVMQGSESSVQNPPPCDSSSRWDDDTLYIPHKDGYTRYFKEFAAPHLYYDPNNGDGMIYLSFTAAEILDNDLNDNGVIDSDLNRDGIQDYEDSVLLPELVSQQATCYIAWIGKTAFLRGDPFVAPGVRDWNPVSYMYQVNNTGAWRRDGGAAQGVASGTYCSIPTSGHSGESRRYKPGQEIPGNAFLLYTGIPGDCSFGFHWAGIGPRAWMAVDPVVYFDPSQDCAPWIIWTWAQHSGFAWDNNNIAAFPLRGGPFAGAGYRLMDAFYQNPHFPPPNRTQPLQLFFAYDTNNSFQGVPNGMIVKNPNDPANAASWHCGGVAEAPDVFTYAGRVYALASRNPWTEPCVPDSLSRCNRHSRRKSSFAMDWVHATVGE